MAESAPQLPEDNIEAAAQQPVQNENVPADRYNGMTYEQRLYEFSATNRDSRFRRGVVDFRDLSYMNIVHLMNELAKYDGAMEKDKAAPQDIGHVEDLLHRYTTAIQDREYWSSLPKHGAWERFIYRRLQAIFPSIYRDEGLSILLSLDEAPKSTSGSVDPLRGFLKRVLPRGVTWTSDETSNREIDYFLGMTPEKISPFVDRLARFIVAITGGLSLVVPMLVMRLGETLPKSLTTVSVAVVFFSALTAFMFKASNVETLAATAAYAAVLVVFVGTNT